MKADKIRKRRNAGNKTKKIAESKLVINERISKQENEI